MAILTRYLENNRTISDNTLAWLVTLSGGLLFFYELIQLNIINSVSTQLMSTFGLNAEQLGHLSSVYFYADMSLLFLAGNLLDRYSTRKLILFSMFVCTIGTVIFGVSHSLILSGIARGIVGIGGSFCFLSGVRLASRWLPPQRMALATGLIVTMCFIGGWVAQTPATVVANWLGWRHMFLVNGALGVLITLWMWFIIQDRPRDQHDRVEKEKALLKEQGVWNSIKFVLRNAQNWLGGFYTCLLNLPIYLLGAMWGKMYLEQVAGFSATDASFICSMLFIGSTLGSPLIGAISDYLGQRRLPMLVGAVLALIIVSIFVYVPHLSMFSYCVLFFFLGLITCTQTISYVLAVEHNPHILTGAAVSIVSMTCLLGGAIGFPFSGWLLDLGWDGKMINGAPWYSVTAYHHAMLIMPVAFIVGFILAYFIKETHCRRQYN